MILIRRWTERMSTAKLAEVQKPKSRIRYNIALISCILLLWQTFICLQHWHLPRLSVFYSRPNYKLSSGWEPPCIGDVHLLKVSSYENLQWRLDLHGLKWINHDHHMLPNKRNPLVMKLCQCAALKMMRMCYEEWNRKRVDACYVLVQYIADSRYALHTRPSWQLHSKLVVTSWVLCLVLILSEHHTITRSLWRSCGSCRSQADSVICYCSVWCPNALVKVSGLVP